MSVLRRALLLLLLAGAPGWVSAAGAAEVHVVSSGGFAAALKALGPEWEKQTGNHLVLDWGPSMGETANAVPQRLARGEAIDLVIMVGSALDKLVEAGRVQRADTRVLARSGIGVVVKQGMPTPDVGTVDGLRQALLAARSIAYSDSASGVYIEREMFRKMGIEDQVRPKARMIPATPVGEIVARGEAEIGFQQISELKPVVGVTLLGPLPPSLQLYTDFSGGVLADSREGEAARSLLSFLASPGAATAITNSGMEPAGPPK